MVEERKCGKCGTNITCGRCQGTGKIQEEFGVRGSYKTCPVCDGHGYDRNHQCSRSSRQSGGNIIINKY
jgi:hypothetical protein